MRKILNRALTASLAVAAVAFAGATVLHAQPVVEIKRALLIKHDASIAGRESVMSSVVIPPNAAEERHTHPGDLTGYVVSGTLTLEVEGQPTATVKPGEAFFIPAEKIHRGVNKGSVPVQIVAELYVEKGKPLAPAAK